MGRLYLAVSAFVLLIAASPAVAVDATTGVRTADHSGGSRIAPCSRPIAFDMPRGDFEDADRDILSVLALGPSNVQAQAPPNRIRTAQASPALEEEKWPTGPRCRLDQVVFTDSKSGRQFAAERVAVDYFYLCDNSATKRYSRPQKQFKDCYGPLGYTIIEGKLDATKAYAVYTVIKGAPCCHWESYLGRLKKPAPKVKEWLRPSEIPTIELNSEWYTISSSPDSPDSGPMKDGEFVPSVCGSQ
jgi:hypothetical protein